MSRAQLVAAWNSVRFLWSGLGFATQQAVGGAYLSRVKPSTELMGRVCHRRQREDLFRCVVVVVAVAVAVAVAAAVVVVVVC